MKYIRVQKSKKTKVNEIAKFVNRYGLNGWVLFAIATPSQSAWKIFHFRHPKKS